MYRLYGSSVRRASYSHRHNISVTAQMSRGTELTLPTMPPLIDGTINFASDGIRRRCDLMFETQTPTETFLSMLDDDQTRYQVRLGAPDLQPMGVYYLRDLSIDDTGQNRNYRLSLQDETALIAERKTPTAATYSGDIIEVAEAILLSSKRSLTFSGVRNLGVTLDNYFVDYGKDPVAVVQQLLIGHGYEMLMGLTGDCIIRQMPGEPSNVRTTDIEPLVLFQQVVQRRRSTNHIIVVSSTPTGQVRGDAYDLDVQSPTYYFGSYGDVPETFSVQGLLSNDECEKAAERIAAGYFHRQATHVYACIQLPNIDLGDGYTAYGMRYTADQLAFSIVAERSMYLTGRGVRV